MQHKIDFVISWVDGSDPAWQESKNRFQQDDQESTASMYRDWGNLQYWFRAVEKYTPWVSRIHLVTWGHLPDWLNTNHPQINIVRHEDYMPAEYLPTFSSHAIELNLHRIAGLEEHFVYFNDDAFIINRLQPEDFFHNGLPCDSAILSSLVPKKVGDPFFHYLVNNISVLNQHFSKSSALKKHPGKWFSPNYGKQLLRNFYYAPVGRFSGILNFHLPASFLKSTFQELWENESALLHATSSHRFRSLQDVNQYVFSYWQIGSGRFWPRNPHWGRFYIAGKNHREMLQDLAARKYKVICINDSDLDFDFQALKEAVNRQLQQLLPEKSAFEL